MTPSSQPVRLALAQRVRLALSPRALASRTAAPPQLPTVRVLSALSPPAAFASAVGWSVQS
jgi:hypothetical protein